MSYVLIFIIGAIIGSFLNVCIYRIPLGLSIVKPRSFCVLCKGMVEWYDNIPLISFLVLRGKCRKCGGVISPRYFVVELITALSGVILFYFFPSKIFFPVYWFFTCLLITVTFIDIDRQEIPDVISLPGIVIGLAAAALFGMEDGSGRWAGFLNSLIGVLVGGGSMFLLGVLGEFIFKKEALGGGDVKLMAMIGAFLGWKFTLLTFFLAPILGSGIGLVMKFKMKKDVIAYGPYIAAGAVVSMLYGNRILEYLFPF